MEGISGVRGSLRGLGSSFHKKKRPRQRLQENQHECLQEGNTICQGRRPAGSKAYHAMQQGKYINSLRELGKGCRYVHGWGRLQPHGGGAREVGASKYEALWGEYECQWLYIKTEETDDQFEGRIRPTLWEEQGSQVLGEKRVHRVCKNMERGGGHNEAEG